jgi:hypothetical protein
MAFFVISGVSRAAVTDYWPLLSFIIKVTIYKCLGFNSGFMTYLDYVLSIHFYSLSLLICSSVPESIVFIYIDVCAYVFIPEKIAKSVIFFGPIMTSPVWRFLAVMISL